MNRAPDEVGAERMSGEAAGGDLLDSLSRARWCVAARTFGSSHATLIGLLVDWWVSLDPCANTALDGAPSHGRRNAGQGDALFCANGQPVGILEAEGTRPLAKLESIGSYLSTERPELASLRFGLLLLYSYAPTGRGRDRRYRPAEDPPTIEAVKKLTESHRNRFVIAITLEKTFGRIATGIRSTSVYYSGQTSRIAGLLFFGGREAGRKLYFNQPG